MPRLFRLPSAQSPDPAVADWFAARPGPLGELARRWYETLRAAGPDVHELVHDGQATVCVGDAAFAYVATYAAHVGLGFYPGAELADPAGLLEGAGRFMRHVKLRPGTPVDEAALRALIAQAYAVTAAAAASEAPPR